MALIQFPSRRVFIRSAVVAALTTAFTMSISIAVRAYSGIEADGVTVAIRLIMPFATAYPIALAYFVRLETLELSYGELLRKSKELAKQALADPLTGLLNRRAFIPQFELAAEHRVDGVFLVADVDYLKDVNDQHGHAVGDLAIISVAQAFEAILPEQGMIARIGGDEFCAYVPNVSIDQAMRWKEGLDAKVREIFARQSGMDAPLASVSVGAVAVGVGMGFNDALRAADVRLYGTKRERRSEALL